MKSFKLFLILSLAIAACGIPEDPEKSWEEIQAKGMNIGVINNPPYSIYTNDSVMGSEIEILQQFASQNKIDIQFIKGHESYLFHELEKRRLHLIAGGIKKKNVWRKKSGPSCSYDGHHIFTIPNGENKLLYRLDNFIIQYRYGNQE